MPGAAGIAPAGADLGVRFGARVIDQVLLFVVQAVIIVPIVVGALVADSAVGATSAFSMGFSFASILASLVGLAITLGYYVFMETTRGWTLGKKLLNLEVKGAGGGLPTVEESLRRNGFYALAIVPFLGGLLQLAAVIWIAVTIQTSNDNIGVHDTFAGTVVRKA